jgi:endonuclease/exonuclease/phosphatase family metal-dependent hydrolase
MELDLLTWNVDGLDERHLDLRSEAACLEVLLQPKHPHVVCLQEVVARSFHAHFVPHFRHAGFHPFPARPPDNANYFDVVFVREPLVVDDAQREPFPASRLGRVLTSVRIAWEGRTFVAMTGHLESLREGSEERKRQLAEVARRLRSPDTLALFAGDTNLRDAETEGLLDDVGDAWVMVGSPTELRHTWDPSATPNIRGGKGWRALRFDRVLLSAGWTPTTVAAAGRSPVDGADGLWPSDHVGLRVSLTSG